MRPCTIAIGTIGAMGGLVFTRSSLQNNSPRGSLENHREATKCRYDTDVRILPLLFRVQNVEPLEYVYNAQQNHSVSDCVVVYIPVQPVLVCFVWP